MAALGCLSTGRCSTCAATRDRGEDKEDPGTLDRTLGHPFPLAPPMLSLPSSAARCRHHVDIDAVHQSLPTAPEDVQETGLFVFVLYLNLLELERPGAAAIDPSPSAMGAHSCSSRSGTRRPIRARRQPSLDYETDAAVGAPTDYVVDDPYLPEQPDIGVQEPDATVGGTPTTLEVPTTTYRPLTTIRSSLGGSQAGGLRLF
ncbi:uncharacterized protein LOC125535137 isoform X1 [Triticum urartu]|uniref:uncharacterized protein LOC125535137 isoform X1 n=1 Tax=Triticum urartu TaxID=4572 RepID=UPI002044A53D|nr:uncharacterized protein LOC125535137 isoform X1 [Triticum urartu]